MAAVVAQLWPSMPDTTIEWLCWLFIGACALAAVLIFTGARIEMSDDKDEDSHDDCFGLIFMLFFMFIIIKLCGGGQ